MSFINQTFILLAFISTSAWAGPSSIKPKPVAQCPAIGDEYAEMLAKLDSLKASIRKEANCTDVELKVRSLEELVVSDRQKLLEIIEKGRTESLTQEQSAFVTQYAENITMKVTALYDLFTGSNQCFSDDVKESGVANLAGFVGEASRLVSALTGPWGTPIAISGQVVAGFLTGLDQVMKSRVGYDFKSPKKWASYVQNLCTFDSYRGQISHLLNPKARIAELSDLKTRLEFQMKTLSEKCPNCQTIVQDFANQTESSPAVLAANATSDKPMGTYTLYTMGIYDWTLKEIARIQKEASSHWGQAAGRHLLLQAQEDLEQFLIIRQGPKFIRFQTDKSFEEYGDFLKSTLNHGRDFYNLVYSTDYSLLPKDLSYYFSEPSEFFKKLALKPLNWNASSKVSDDLIFSWNNYHERSLLELELAQTSFSVVQSFCDFFQKSGDYNTTIRNACTNDNIRRLAGQLVDYEGELKQAGIVSSVMPVDMNVFSSNPIPRTGPRSQLDSLKEMVLELNPL